MIKNEAISNQDHLEWISESRSVKNDRIQFPRSRIAGKDHFKECKDVSFTKTWCERSFRTSGKNCQKWSEINIQGCCGFKTVFLTMVNWIILISANLGVMNLLPLPALDGGRLLFLIIEAITGKAVPQNMEAGTHTVGLILLMLLMVFVMYQDIVKIFM